MICVFFCDSIKGVWAFSEEGTGCKTGPLQLQTAVAVFSCQCVSSSCGLQAQGSHSRDASDSLANYNIPGTMYICPLKHVVVLENWSVQAAGPAGRARSTNVLLGKEVYLWCLVTGIVPSLCTWQSAWEAPKVPVNSP